MGRTAAMPPDSADRVLQGLLDRYTATVDDSVTSKSLAVSARGYFLARVAERRCAAEVPNFNNVLKKECIDENGLVEAKEPGLPPRYGRAIHRKMGTRREKIEQAAIVGEGGEPNAAVNTTFCPAPADNVNDRQHACERNVRGRRSLGRIENHEKYGHTLSSNNSVSTPSNRTTPIKESRVPSRIRSNSPSLVNLKPVSDYGKIERLPTKSAISQPLSTASEYKPAVPKAPTRTSSSTMLERSAGVYRRHKNTPSNGTNATEASPVPSRARSFSAPSEDMKSVSGHGKVERLPTKSAISQPLSTASEYKPAVPKAPTKTTSSIMLERSGVYRLHKNPPTNHTTATEASPVPSRARSFSAPSEDMKPVSGHGKVERLPPKSVISQPISIASQAKPAVIPSTLLQSAGVYRRHKMIAAPQSLMELKPTPTFETSNSFDLKQSTSSEGASFEDDIYIAASLFSVASIDYALSMADMGTKSPPRRGRAIPNLNDVRSGSIKSKVPQKEKYFDDQSAASTITDATSLRGISQTMSDESMNETKRFLSRCGVPLPKREIRTRSYRADLRSRIHQSTSDESTNATEHLTGGVGALPQMPMKQGIHAGSNRAVRRRRRPLSATRSAPKSTFSSSIQGVS